MLHRASSLHLDFTRMFRHNHAQTSPATDDPLHSQPRQLTKTMFLQRSAVAAARRAAVTPLVRRSFATSFVRRKGPTAPRRAIGCEKRPVKLTKDARRTGEAIPEVPKQQTKLKTLAGTSNPPEPTRD